MPLIQKLKRKSREHADPALRRLISEGGSRLPADPPTGQATQARLAIETLLAIDERSAAPLATLRESRGE